MKELLEHACWSTGKTESSIHKARTKMFSSFKRQQRFIMAEINFDQVPNSVRENSLNLHVQAFILTILLKQGHKLARNQAWDMVKNFVGDGIGVFALEEAQWIAEFGEFHGTMLHCKIEQRRNKRRRRRNKRREIRKKEILIDVSYIMLFWNI